MMINSWELTCDGFDLYYKCSIIQRTNVTSLLFNYEYYTALLVCELIIKKIFNYHIFWDDKLLFGWGEEGDYNYIIIINIK